MLQLRIFAGERFLLLFYFHEHFEERIAYQFGFPGLPVRVRKLVFGAVFVLAILLQYGLYQPWWEGAVLHVVIVLFLGEAGGWVLGLASAAGSRTGLAPAIWLSLDLLYYHLALQRACLEPLAKGSLLLVRRTLLLISLFLFSFACDFWLLVQAIEIHWLLDIVHMRHVWEATLHLLLAALVVATVPKGWNLGVTHWLRI